VNNRREIPLRWALVAGVCLASAALLTGCASPVRKDAPVLWFASDAVPVGFPSSVRSVGETRETFAARSAELLPRARAAAGSGPLNMLALSGGGAGGAYGAGALVGWTRQGTRPEFQIVTGVSAGALIAPFAFLGPSWDGQLTEAFSGARTEHLLDRHLPGIFFAASAYRGAPLIALVDSYVTDALLRAVAIEAAKGRFLVVATTDLDKEETVIWNLGEIAAQGGEPARRLFRDVLVASASIPGAFPPVMIRVEESGQSYDEMHVDGGTTASLFIAPEIAGYLTDPLTDLRGGSLYVIVNGQLGTVAQTTPLRTLPIFKRGLVAAFRSNARADFAVAAAFAHRNQMAVKVTDIPADYPYRGPLDLRRSTMKALFDFAARCAAEDQLWESPVEALEHARQAHFTVPDRLAQCPGPVRSPELSPVQTTQAAPAAAAVGSAPVRSRDLNHAGGSGIDGFGLVGPRGD
jgi:patatin-like phospholipase